MSHGLAIFGAFSQLLEPSIRCPSRPRRRAPGRRQTGWSCPGAWPGESPNVPRDAHLESQPPLASLKETNSTEVASDLIRPVTWDTYGIAYRVLQPLLDSFRVKLDKTTTFGRLFWAKRCPCQTHLPKNGLLKKSRKKSWKPKTKGDLLSFAGWRGPSGLLIIKPSHFNGT